MGLARSQRSDVEFLIALRSRCGQLAELSLRASPPYLASLLLVKCRLLRREWLEKLFRVASRRESGVDSLLPWRADSAMLCRRASRIRRAVFRRSQHLPVAPGCTGRLPHPVRYAAVAAIGGRLIVAGGTSGDQATREVYSFDPSSGRVTLIGTLPSPLTHAAAAALGDLVYVIGGRGAVQGSQTASILAVDPISGRIRPAGHLPVALSDVGAATIGGAVMIAGGRQSSGVLSARVYALRPGGGA